MVEMLLDGGICLSFFLSFFLSLLINSEVVNIFRFMPVRAILDIPKGAVTLGNFLCNLSQLCCDVSCTKNCQE